MRKSILTAMTVALCAGSASAAVEVYFTGKPAYSDIDVIQVPISALAEGNKAVQANTKVNTLPVNDGVLKFELDPTVPCHYTLEDASPNATESTAIAKFYAAPDDNISVMVNCKDNGYTSFTVSGTDLMEGISALSQVVMPIESTFQLLRMGFPAVNSEEELDNLLEKLLEKYSLAHKVYIDINNDNPTAAYALLNVVDNDEFLNYKDKIGENAKNSILYPLVEQRVQSINKEKEAQQRLDQMQNGNYEAPNFTLPNQKGKKVSLSQFRGKWVVLDFWGTWCRWCIKGIPDMKEAYAKYKGKAEFIGIDCGDEKEAWLEGLKKYDMPWVQLYTVPKSEQHKQLMADYGVTGYPTKVIINPEGKIAKIVVGEDPEFYTLLEQLIK